MIIDQLIENVIKKQKEKKKSLIQFRKLLTDPNSEQRVMAIREIQNLINQSNYKQAFVQDKIHILIFDQCIQEDVTGDFFKIGSDMLRNLFEENIQAAMDIINKITLMLHKPKYTTNMNFYVTIRHMIMSVAATQTLLGSEFMPMYTKFYNTFVQLNSFNFQMTNSFSYQQYLASIENASTPNTEHSQSSNLSLDEDRAHSINQSITHPKIDQKSSQIMEQSTNQLTVTGAALKKNTLSTQSLLSNFGVTLFEDDVIPNKINIESIAEAAEMSVKDGSDEYSVNTTDIFESGISSTSFFSASEPHQIDNLDSNFSQSDRQTNITAKLTQKLSNIINQSDSSSINDNKQAEPINQQFEQLAISGPMAHPYIDPTPRPDFVPPLNLSFLNRPGIREINIEESQTLDQDVILNVTINPQKVVDTDTAFKDQIDQVHDAKKGQILMSEIGKLMGQFTALSDYTTINTFLVKQKEYNIPHNQNKDQSMRQQYIDILTKNNSREYQYFDIDFIELDKYIDIINNQKPENITRIGYFYLLYQICINSGTSADVYGKDIITSMTIDLAYLRSRKQGMLPASIIAITTFYKSICLMEIPHICDTWLQNLEYMYNYVNIQFKFFDEVSQKYITKEERNMKVTERRVVEKHINCTLIDKFQGYRRSRVILLTIICDKISMLVQHYKNLSALEDISVCLGVLYDVMCATKSFGLIRKAVVDLCFPSLLKLLMLLIERKIRARQYYIFISHRLLQIFNNLLENNYKTNDYQQNNINQILLNLFLHQQIPVNYWLKRYAYFILMNSRVMIEVSGLYTNHEQCEESFVQIRQTFFLYIMNLSELISHYYYTQNFNLNQDAQQISDINIEYCNFGMMSNTAEQNFPRGIDDNFDLKLDIEQLPLNMMLQNLVNKQTMNQLRNKTLFQKQKNTVKENTVINNVPLDGFDIDYIIDYEVGVIMQYLINNQDKIMNNGKDRQLYLTCLQAFERFVNIPTIIGQLQKPQLNQFIIFHYLSFLKFYNTCLETYGQFIISNFQLAAAHLLVLQKFSQIDDYEVKQHIHSIGIVEFLTQQLNHEVNMPNNIELDTSSSTVSYTNRSNSTLTLADLESDFFENDIKPFVQLPSIEQSDVDNDQQLEKLQENDDSIQETDSSMLSDVPINQAVIQKRPQIDLLPLNTDMNPIGVNNQQLQKSSRNQPLIKRNTLQLLPAIGNLPDKNEKIENQSYMIDVSIPVLNLNYNNDNNRFEHQELQVPDVQMKKEETNPTLDQLKDLQLNFHKEAIYELEPDRVIEDSSDQSSENYSNYDSDDLSDIPIQPKCQNNPNSALCNINIDLELPPSNLLQEQTETIPLSQMETAKVPLITNRSQSDSFDYQQQKQQTDFNAKFHLIHGLKSSKKVQQYFPNHQTVGIPQIPIYYDDHLHEVLIILLMHLIIKTSTQTFDPYYVMQFPSSRGVTNILFILHQHLNHKNNQTVVNKLLDSQHPPAIKRLLRLLCYQQFNTSFYNLDKFTLVAKGAFGEVYYGHVDLIKFKELEAYSTPVALKIQPLSKDIYDRCVLHDLYNEITAMERLQEFQSFCQIYDYGVTPQGYIMVMQKYHTSFRDFRRQLFTPPGKQINVNMLPRYGHEESMMKYVRIFLFTYMMLLEQLQIMHQNKVIHFDLKTDNIFVSPATIHWICLNELPKIDNTGDFQRSLLNKFLKIYNQYQLPYSITLGDFGESYIYSSESDKQTLLPRGTEFNKSPEMLTATNGNLNQQFIHGRQQGSGPPSDVWSAACTLYEILTGDYLFYDTDWFRFFARVTTIEQNIEYGKDSFTFSNCPEVVQCIRGLRLTPQKKAMLGNCQPLIDLLEFQLVQVPMLRPSIHQCIEMTRHVINVYFPHSYNYIDGTNQQQFEVSQDAGQHNMQFRQNSRKSDRPGVDPVKNKNAQQLDFVMQNCKFPEVAWDFTIHQTLNEAMENIYDVLTPHATILNKNMNIKGVKLQMIKQKHPTKPSDILGNRSIWLGNVSDLQNFQFIAENNIQTIVDCTTTNVNLKNGFVSRVFRPNNKLFQLFKNEIKVIKKEDFKKLIILLDQIADVVRCTFTLNGCLLFIDETSNNMAANLSLFCIMEFQLMHLYQSTVYLKQLRPGARLNVNFMELLLFWHEKRHKIGMKMLSLFANTKIRINKGINMHDPEIYNFATTRVSQANYRCVCGRTFFLIKPKVETQYIICNCVISDEYGRVKDHEGVYIDCPTSSCRTIQNYYMQLFGLKLYKLVWAYLPSEGLISNCDHTTRQVADMPEFKDSMRHDFQLHGVDETRAPLYRLQNKPGWVMYYCVLCGSPTHCIKATKSGTEVAVLATFSNK